ncbi:hypothetical protein CANINC_001318 [Pichia inconspicua]|uniref:Copper transport protein n=1 Tax=Pichia inconspicua TaxID=52247 RepID=A0A4T0X5K8_9ASCO|nr:hypothetical protein CANINC_001318 [[Candida] inconspicua]
MMHDKNMMHDNNMMQQHDCMMHHNSDHSAMKTSMDMGHNEPGMKMCKMSMTLNSDYENLCILTDKLMVTTKTQMILAMILVSVFAALFEYYRAFVDKLQHRYAQYLQSGMVTEKERLKYKLILSTAYSVSVGYSFIIMLLFMSFNVWVMLAVCIGAGLGHFLCERKSGSVSLVCH